MVLVNVVGVVVVVVIFDDGDLLGVGNVGHTAYLCPTVVRIFPVLLSIFSRR